MFAHNKSSVYHKQEFDLRTQNKTNKNVLTDSFDRRIDYVRLSVTEQCDLRCFYCLPKGYKANAESEQWLSFEEIERVVKSFAQLGVSRVRITGGEPLLRKNLPDLLQRLNKIPGIEDLSLSTNATRLEKMAAHLKQAGVSRINVSLDSLQPDRFKQITGGKLEKVLNGLQAAKAAGLQPVKINMLVMKGINDDEVFDMVLRNEEPLSRRAIWVLDLASEEQPELMEPNLVKLFQALPNFKHDGLKRHSLRILNRYPISETIISTFGGM